MSERKGRMNRRQQMSLEIISAAETQQLENAVAKISILDLLQQYVPIIAWIVWIFLGAVFYSFHNGYDWSEAIYMSVNVGWGMNWTIPESMINEDYQSPMFQLFSAFHTIVGAVFLGASAIYISNFAAIKKDQLWFKRTAMDGRTSRYQRVVNYLETEVPHYKIVCFFVLWLLFGILWFANTQDGWNVVDSADYVASSVTGAGFKAIAIESATWKYAMAALYATIGVPIMAITIGLSVSHYFEPSNEDTLEKLFADVTQQELDFMVEYGLDDGDGLVDKEEFIILMVVRIGKATPTLIARLSERFKELNRRKDVSGRIHLDDIVAGRRHITPEMRKLMFANRGLSSMNLRSFADVNGRPNKVHPQRIRSASESSEFSDSGDSSGITRQISDGIKRIAKSRRRALSSELLSSSIDETEEATRTQSPLHSNVAIETPLAPSIRANEAVGRVRGFSFGSADDCDSKSADEYESPMRSGGVLKEIKSTLKEDAVSVASLVSSHPLSKPVFIPKQDIDEDLLSENESDLDKFDGLELQSFDKGSKSFEVAESSTASLKSKSKNAIPLHLLMENLRTKNDASEISFVSQKSDNKVTPMRSSSVSNQERKSSVYFNILGTQVWKIKSSFGLKIYRYVAHPHVRLLLAWLIWLLCGTMFYYGVNKSNSGDALVHSFFTSVSVGLSMFWITVKQSTGVKIYTMFHMLSGSVLLGSVRAAVAHSLAESKLNWYIDAMQRKEALDFKHGTITENIWSFLKYYGPKLKIHALLVVFIAIGVALSCGGVGWSFLDGLYFSVSALATGGLYPLPDNSDNWLYLVTGVLVSFGAPVMAVSVSMSAAEIANIGVLDNLEKVVNTIITEEEIRLMASLGFENGDEYIDKSEFILLMLVRLGALNTDLVGIIVEWYGSLNKGTKGLSYDQITHADMKVATPMRKKAETIIMH